jgi:hypothetical protein
VNEIAGGVRRNQIPIIVRRSMVLDQPAAVISESRHKDRSMCPLIITECEMMAHVFDRE